MLSTSLMQGHCQDFLSTSLSCSEIRYMQEDKAFFHAKNILFGGGVVPIQTFRFTDHRNCMQEA